MTPTQTPRIPRSARVADLGEDSLERFVITDSHGNWVSPKLWFRTRAAAESFIADGGTLEHLRPR